MFARQERTTVRSCVFRCAATLQGSGSDRMPAVCSGTPFWDETNETLPSTESNGNPDFPRPPTPEYRKTVVTCNCNLYMFVGLRVIRLQLGYNSI